jgi:hypothetical protein
MTYRSQNSRKSKFATEPFIALGRNYTQELLELRLGEQLNGVGIPVFAMVQVMMLAEKCASPPCPGTAGATHKSLFG